MESLTHIPEFTGVRAKAGQAYLGVVKTYHFFQHEETAEIKTSH
jgi:hypothetical protein